MNKRATKNQMNGSVKAYNAARDAAYAQVTAEMIAADPSLSTAKLMDSRWDARSERVTAAAKAAQAAYLADCGVSVAVKTDEEIEASRREVERFLDRS